MSPIHDDQAGRISRRTFISRSAVAAAAAVGLPAGSLLAADGKFHAIPDSPLPRRKFGKTGAMLPILTFGCGSRWLAYEDEEAGLRVLTRAIDQGVIYLDTAHGYQNGRKISEEWIGKLMPARRQEVLIQTKIASREPDQFRRDLELSLQRLKVDYVDMLLIHDVKHEEDQRVIEAKGGTMEQLLKAKEQGLTRWVGCSNHTDSRVMAALVERYPLDGIQMGLNVATNGPHDMGFEETTLPVATSKGIGVIAMKVMGQDQIVGKYEGFDYRTCLRYSLSLPITSATVGMPKPEHLEQNLALVRDFQPFTKAEMAEIKAKAQGTIQTGFLDFMDGHRDTGVA